MLASFYISTQIQLSRGHRLTADEGLPTFAMAAMQSSQTRCVSSRPLPLLGQVRGFSNTLHNPLAAHRPVGFASHCPRLPTPMPSRRSQLDAPTASWSMSALSSLNPPDRASGHVRPRHVLSLPFPNGQRRHRFGMAFGAIGSWLVE